MRFAVLLLAWSIPLAAAAQAKPEAPVPAQKPGAASRGASALPPSGPEDAAAARERAEDERKATRNKEKMKKRPGFKEEVPSPRA